MKRLCHLISMHHFLEQFQIIPKGEGKGRKSVAPSKTRKKERNGNGCRHCFVAGVLPNEVRFNWFVHQNRLISFTKCAQCDSSSFFSLSLSQCNFFCFVYLLLFSGFCCCIVWFCLVKLAEHCVDRLVFNTLSSMISSALFG